MQSLRTTNTGGSRDGGPGEVGCGYGESTNASAAADAGQPLHLTLVLLVSKVQCLTGGLTGVAEVGGRLEVMW